MKQWKYLLLLLVMVGIMGMVPTHQASAQSKVWDGTYDISWYNSNVAYFEIHTPEQFAGMFKLIGEYDVTFEGVTIRLCEDIYLNKSGFQPSDSEVNVIRRVNYGTAFRGIFDGNGNTIYNVYTTKNESKYTSIFGGLVGAIIKNLTIDGFYGVDQGGSTTLGILTTNTTSSQITNVQIKNSYTKYKYTGSKSTAVYVGAISGMLSGSVENCTVENTTIECNLEEPSYEVYMGILVGMSQNKTINNCHVTNSTLEVKGKAYGYVGGLIGYGSTGTPENSFALTGIKDSGCDNIKILIETVLEETGATLYVGGVSGYQNATVDGVYAYGEVICNASNSVVVCDLFGTVKYNHRYVDCNKAITNTVANMKVTNKNSGKVFTYGVTKEFEIYDIYKLPEETIRNDIMSNIYHNVYLPEGKPLFSDFYAKPWPSRESSPIVYDMSKAVTGVNLISAGRFTNGGLAYTLSNTSGRLWCQGSKGPRIPTQNEYPSRKITYMVDNVTISTRYTDAKGMTSFPSNPSKSGYLFQGWYVNTRKASSLTVFTKDSIVVAKFIKLVNLTSVSASISTTSHTYTGAAICPVVTVKYGTTTLVKDKDYTVSYGNNTNIGKATILIKGKGTYTGSKSITFQIIPRKAVISKLSSGSKGRLSVTWKKDTMVTGYQIQYSTSGSFEKSVKTVTIKNNKTVSNTISNLTSKKVYYVRIRSYKTIGGMTYYGPYSLVMKVGVK